MAQKEMWAVQRKITGVLLRQARLDAGKTLKECGHVLGLSSGAISSVEHGRRAISLPELEMLAFYLGVSLDQLLNGSVKPSRAPADELPRDELLVLRHRIVGALLRQARVELSLSQAELAKRVGVSKRQLSHYELGEKPIPLVELESLAEALEVPLHHFLDEGIGPFGEQQQSDRQCQEFVKLPLEIREFVLEPANLSYLKLAMSLSEASTDKLRSIAASLLDITL
jgi:transcriptional regulator with XRE-family HTH domain